ncbi:MAG: efflux RND transporter permease subunit [Elusimicrobia bacterium]|nr:efflux RND transporter permease subunit [Elusimicrobiota bacterium]
MIFSGVCLMGLITWFLNARELFPSISFPQLLVITRYGNAAPEEIENLITKVIEESVGTVPNLKRVRSLSKEGISLVTMEFDWGTDMGFAHLSAREKIDQIKDRLPSDSEEPIINRINPFAQPMMIYSISGSLPMSEMTRQAKTVIKQRLEKVTGVASAVISGGQEREIRVEVDMGRMEATGVSLNSLVDSLKETNLNYPGGTTMGKTYEYLVVTKGEFKHIGEIGRTVVKVSQPPDEGERGFARPGSKRDASSPKDQRLVYLDTMSETKDDFKEQTSFSRHNGMANISIAVQKQADANTLNTAERVLAAIREIRLVLPKGVQLDLVYNEADFIRDAINGLVVDSILGGILAFLVLYFFLRNVTSSVIAALTIPLSAMFTFICMYFGHVSINLLSLAGIGLAVGALVDNAIVCMENVTRHREELGKDHASAAIDGTQEVVMPMFSSAITNVAVFLPLLFVQGAAQKLFRDLFIANALATMGSYFVAITLIPQLVSHPVPLAPLQALLRRFFPKKDPDPTPVAVSAASPGLIRRGLRYFSHGIPDKDYHLLTEGYKSVLDRSIRSPRKLSLLLGLLVVLSLVLMGFQPKVFMPQFDQGRFILKIDLPVGTRLEITNKVMEKVERKLREVSAVTDISVAVGSNHSDAVDALSSFQAQAIVNLDRHRMSTDEVIEDIKTRLEKENLEGAQVQFLLQGSVLASAFESSSPILIEIKGHDLATLRKMSEDVTKEIETVPGIYGVKTTLALPSPETRVEVDRERAASYNLSVSEIARTALIGLKGFVATTYKEGGQEVDVRVQLRPEDRANTDSVRRLVVQTHNGLMVPLSEISTIVTARGPSEIKHLDQQRAVLISANILKRSSSDVIADIDSRLGQFEMADYHLKLSGESQQMKESFGPLGIAMVMGVLANYMIMAAEFEDLWHPLIVLGTIPLGVIGVALSLYLTGTPLSAPVILGCIMLGGMVVNNGIVLIDFMNVLRRSGVALREAVFQASTARFRPIVMSNMTSVLGVLPLASGLTEGSELTSPMAVVAVGGLTVSALLTLILIPLLYYYWEKWRADRAATEIPVSPDPEPPAGG